MQTRPQAIHDLNGAMPASAKAKLGQTIDDLVQNYNALKADHDALVVKYAALLAHLDTANVAGIGNANAATYGAAVDTSATIAVLGAR